MKKSILYKSILYKEKTNKMYLLMLCGLLVSGAIVCSTNGNGDGNGNGNGNGNGDPHPFMFTCPNGTAFTPTADNRPIAAGVENCASCEDGFTLEAVRGSNRMVCRTPYVCPDGVAVIPTEDDRPTVVDVENCVFCKEGFGKAAQNNRTICRTPYACPNGVAVVPIGDNMPTVANEENCVSCDPGFGDPVAVAGSDPQRSICSGNELPIALWNAGRHDGNFGFDFCQNSIAQSYDGSDAAVTAQRSSAIATHLRSSGYTKAVFFGSTNTYDFSGIGSDINALALRAVGGGSPVPVSDKQLVVFTASGTPATVNVIGTFGASAVTRTLGNVTNVTMGGAWQNGGADVVGAAGITGFAVGDIAWSFTLDRAYSPTSNCTGATSNSPSTEGGLMDVNSVDSIVSIGNSGVRSCNRGFFVLCVAR